MRRFNLDDDSLYTAYDPSDMFGAIYRLPEQLAEAVQLTRQSGVSIQTDGLQNIVVTGLGGSAVGGDLLRTYAADKCAVPILVNRSYTMPSFVDAHTCVIAVSYSGNTEETLSAYDDAKRRGAQIIAITSGGDLQRRAEADGYPTVLVPGGLQPRAATGYLFLPQLLLAAEAGLVPSVEADVIQTLALLQGMRERLAPTCPQVQNSAKQLAGQLHGRIPLIHSAVGITEILSYRWKTQLNENAQTLAFAHSYPELNHNEIVGFDVPGELMEKLEVITLICSKNHPQVVKRMEITAAELIGPSGCGTTQVAAEGESDLAQVFSLLYIGDYVSAYLALAYGIDPTPVARIEHLKKRLTAEP